MLHKGRQRLRSKAIAIARPPHESLIVTAPCALEQAQAAKDWIDEVSRICVQSHDGPFATSLTFRFVPLEDRIGLEVVCQEQEQLSLLPAALGHHLDASGIFDVEVSTWCERLRAVCQDHEITVFDRPALSTAANRLINDPVEGYVPIATADEIALAAASALSASIEVTTAEGERFDLSAQGALGPVWEGSWTVRGLPVQDRRGFVLKLISVPPRFAGARRLLLRTSDLTPEESSYLAGQANRRLPVELHVLIATGASRHELLGALTQAVNAAGVHELPARSR